jgi:two-component system copper resistance phosphate regulon response regulator CusR
VRVLIVDDDPKLRSFLSRGLEEDGAECKTAADGDEMDRVLDGASFDVILLDVMMPGRDGWSMLESLRSAGDETPVIFLTARHSVEERIRGLSLGADDYVLKPFEFGELLARIQAVLRRRKSVPRLEFGPLRIDPVRRTARHGTQLLELSPRDLDLLQALIEVRGAVLSRRELLRDVWHMEFDPGTNVVEVAIARLRKRIHPSGPARIETQVGEGYYLSANND